MNNTAEHDRLLFNWGKILFLYPMEDQGFYSFASVYIIESEMKSCLNEFDTFRRN